jgi:trans-aconitate 2-methyltransferase
MNQLPNKDFGPIQDDYAFFLDHSTEQERDVEAYVASLGSLRPLDRPLRLLDFGCGPGGFTEVLLKSLAWPPARIRLSLVEPVEDYRRQAVARLSPLVASPVIAHAALPAGAFGPFELIVSNHVLYYVPNLDEILARLCDALAPGGRFLMSLAGHDNVLIQFWHEGFAAIGRSMPYHVAEGVEAALTRAGRSFARREVPYEITFDDTNENRLRILRFLFAEHFNAIPRPVLLGLFDPYRRAGRIVIETKDVHLAIGATDEKGSGTLGNSG